MEPGNRRKEEEQMLMAGLKRTAMIYRLREGKDRPLPTKDFLGGSDGKASACNAGDLGSIPGLGRSSGEVNGNPLQYSCLENSMGRGA